MVVSLERRGYGEFGLGVAVENINELILLNRGDEACSALGICSKVLTWDDTAYARLPKCLQVDTREAVFGRKVLDDSDAA